jgi:ADP-heptose:LPS heptosyltransferase
VKVIIVVSGDLVEVLQASPLITAVSALEGVEITLALPPAANDLIAGLPKAKEVITLRALGPRTDPVSWFGMWWQLRKRRLHAALLCTSRADIRLAAYAAGISQRIGPDSGNFAFLQTDTVPAPPGDNNTVLWARLADALGVMQVSPRVQFEIDPVAKEKIETEIKRSEIATAKILVTMAPGWGPVRGNGSSKWQPERYAHLGNQLHERYGAGLILVGDVDTKPLIDAIRVDLSAPSLDLCGMLSFAEIAALIDRSDLFIGGDSPLLQFAAAASTTTVGLFGPTDGRKRGPYGDEQLIIQATHGKVQEIRVEDVLATIESSL